MLRLLGEVVADADGHPVDLGHPKQRCLLAALAVDTGRVVPADRLLERVWGADVPRRGRATLHSYISRLRQALADVADIAIERRSGGYVLTASVVDLHRFRELCAQARAENTPRKARLLTEALDLWRGEPLTGLPGEWAEAERDRLESERLAAWHDLVDARLSTGQGERVIVELSVRSTEHPLDERVAAQYMLALHQAGRTADALAHYRRMQVRLVEALGTDPGASLQELHQRLLGEDPGAATTSEPAVPRQLPAAPAPFVGRHEELRHLDTASAVAEPGATTAVVAVAGAGGIGKTWLALHWAHRHVERFPDGQLFVDLRGFSVDTTPLDPAAAVRGFIEALGVDAGRVPADLRGMSSLFRTLVADRRMLIVLDNAATAEQVAPLLPGGRSCTVLVTSRRVLTELVSGHLDLDVLDDAEGRTLLEHRLGAARQATDPRAVAALLDWCRGFPLALGILAGRAQTHPHLPLAELAAEVRESGVDALDDDDPTASLPAVLATSRRALTGEQRTVFGLLGIAPGPDIGLSAAASLTGRSPAHTAQVLQALQEASLLHRNAQGRYTMHDLIRGYAATTAAHLPEDLRSAALRRVADFFLHTAHTAQRLLLPHIPALDLDPPAPAVHTEPLPDAAAALTWLDTEHACLLAAQLTAAGQHRHNVVCQLASSLIVFHDRRGHREADLAVCRTALASAGRLEDPGFRIRAYRNIGYSYGRLGQQEEAVSHFRQGLELAERHDPSQAAHIHRALAWAWEQAGDRQQSLEHARQALRRFRSLGDSLGEARALNLMGWCLARLGEYGTAFEYSRAALVRNREHDNPDGEAYALANLGYLGFHTGRHDESVRDHELALGLYRSLEFTVEIAMTLEGIGHPHAALGRVAEARKAWREAMELYSRLGRDDDAERLRAHLGPT